MQRDPASVEEAVELFLELRRRGEAPAREGFLAAHAHLGPELPEALEALAALAGLEARAEPEDAVPERIGAFRIVREIGRGGMGVVLEAIEEPLGRRVALKLLPAHALQSSSARARFRREAEFAARLDHPGLATLYATGVEGDRPWIAMRYVEGLTLAQAIRAQRHAHAPGATPSSPSNAAARASGASSSSVPASSGVRALVTPLAAARCIARIARALQAAHERGIVHRDVKPSNVIVAPDGTPVLVDFGLAIQSEASGETLTRTGETAGTPAYLAPELISGECARHDAQSDVYALGVTLYECLALRRPFEAHTPAALYRAILTSSPTGVRGWNRAVPRDLAVVVATAMERDRVRRYASAAALAQDLEACLAQRPIAARPVPLSGRVLRWARREPRQAGLAGLLLLAALALALLGGSWWSAHRQVLAAERVTRAQALEDALESGFGAIDAGHPGEADGSFARALELDARNLEARVGLVLASLWAERDTQAAERLRALAPDTPGLAALRALVEHADLPLDPDIPPQAPSLELLIRGQVLQLQSMRLPYSERRPVQALALRFLTEAALRAPTARPGYHELRAGVAQQLGDEAAARSAAATLTGLWPDSARALYAAGRALYAFEPTRARTLLERSQALRPESLDTYNLLVQACLQAGQSEDAEGWCWRGLALDPGAGALHFLLGVSLGNRDCAGEAREAYVRATACDARMHAAWSQLATLDLIASELEPAAAGFARALQGDPENARVRLFYGATLDARGDGRAAQAELDRSIASLYPADKGLWTQFAAVFLQLRAPGAALRMAETGLALAPDDPTLRQLHELASQSAGR